MLRPWLATQIEDLSWKITLALEISARSSLTVFRVESIEHR